MEPTTVAAVDLDRLQTLLDTAAGEEFLPFGWRRIVSYVPSLVAELRATREAAPVLEALRQYGSHLKTCVITYPWTSVDDPTCTCGLREAAARAEAFAECEAKGITETTELLAVGRDLKARADDVIGLENAAYDKGRAEAFAEIRRGVEGLQRLDWAPYGLTAAYSHDGLWLERAAVMALLPSVPPEETT